MKDKVKCKIIDAILLGHDIEIVWNSIWNCWSLSHGSTKLFSWRRNDVMPSQMEELTLKQCLAIIDQCWEDRIVTGFSDQWTAA